MNDRKETKPIQGATAMQEYIELGSTPCDEDCAQVGTDDYGQRMRIEARAYVDQLYRMFPDAAINNVSFRNKGFPHDFGTYHEVCAFYDADDEKSVDYAYYIENNLPAKWDTQASLAIDLYNGKNSTYIGNMLTIGAVLANKRSR